MRLPHKKLFIMLSVSALVACGGGGGDDGDTGPAPVSLKLSGTVNQVGGAAVDVQMGDNVVATGVSDANGNYSVKLSVAEEDHAKQVVVKARRTRDKVAYTSLVGSAGNIVSSAAAADKEVDASEFNDLHVTNVTTAVYAMLDDLDNDAAKTPSQLSDDEVKQLKGRIKTESNLQAKVVDTAAAITAVVEYGADVNYDGSGIADTQALANAIVKKGDSAATQIELEAVVATATVPVTSAELEGKVTTDATLASQLIIPALVPADLVGNSYFMGHNTIVRFDSYDAGTATGVATLGDYDAIVGVTYDGVSGSFVQSTPTPPQSWTMSGEQISVYGLDEDNLPISMDLTLSGGTADAMPVTFTVNEGGGTFSGTANLIRMIDANSFLVAGTQNIDFTQLPAVSFDLKGGEVAQLPSACDGIAVGQMSNNGSMMPVTCSISASGEFLFQVDPAYTGGMMWPPSLVAPLVGGAIGQMALLPNFSLLSAVVDPKPPVNHPAMNSAVCTATSLCGKFRITDDGLVSMSFADHVNQVVNLFLERAPGSYIGKQKLLSDVTDPELGTALNVRSSINTDLATGQSYVYRLPGGNADLSYAAVLQPGTPSVVSTRSEYKMTGFQADGSDVAGKSFTLVDPSGKDPDATVTFGAINTEPASPSYGYGSITFTGQDGSVLFSGLWKVDTSVVLDDGTSPLANATASDLLAGSGLVVWTYRSTLELNDAGTSYYWFWKGLDNSGGTTIVDDIWMDVVTEQ